jgi:hypothetical protein
MSYEQYVEKWITQHYKDPSAVNYTVAFLSYQCNTITFNCTKYILETPYNIVKLHIEFEKDDPSVNYVYACISIKMPDDEKAQTEKTELKTYFETIKDIIIKNNKELNKEYYRELQQECAIEYARDHC